jgi:hypothetical protein
MIADKSLNYLFLLMKFFMRFSGGGYQGWVNGPERRHECGEFRVTICKQA